MRQSRKRHTESQSASRRPIWRLRNIYGISNEAAKETYEAGREIRRLLRASEGKGRETSDLTSYSNY